MRGFDQRSWGAPCVTRFPWSRRCTEALRLVIKNPRLESKEDANEEEEEDWSRPFLSQAATWCPSNPSLWGPGVFPCKTQVTTVSSCFLSWKFCLRRKARASWNSYSCWLSKEERRQRRQPRHCGLELDGKNTSRWTRNKMRTCCFMPVIEVKPLYNLATISKLSNFLTWQIWAE